MCIGYLVFCVFRSLVSFLTNRRLVKRLIFLILLQFKKSILSNRIRKHCSMFARLTMECINNRDWLYKIIGQERGDPFNQIR